MPGFQSVGASDRTSRPWATSPAAIRQQMLTDYYLQRLILSLEFNASRATRFSSFMIPVETITSPCDLLEMPSV